MSTLVSPEKKFQIGHVLFIDMVGYSKLLIDEQTRALRELNELVQGTDEFRAADKRHKLVRIATGDGVALVFRESFQSPVRCAFEISRALRKRSAPLSIRMGIHSGLVNEVTDVNKRINIAGPGMNIAQRVMDCGDAGHILLSRHVAEDLEHDARWRPFLHDVGECEVKHGYRLGLVNLYDSDAGNPQLPEKIRRIRKKRAASSALVFSTAAAVGLMIVGGSWFLSTRFQTAEIVTPPVTAATPAATPESTIAQGPDVVFANARLADSVWSRAMQPSPIAARPEKLFAGTWRGTVHTVGPRSAWDSPVELNIDETESQLSNMTGGSVSRSGRTLTYRRSYKLGSSTSVQVNATLVVHEDNRTATYTTSQISVTGKSRSKTSGTGTLERAD